MLDLETRWDPILGYDYTYWPDSKYFRNYRFSPSISVTDPWSYRSRVWFPYYWSTRRLFNHFNDYRPSYEAMRDVRTMIYLNYPYPTLDYYPDSTRIYRPLTCYYNYYYPIRSLNYYSDVWPYYPYYRYLYYKYTLPSDRYYHLKGRIVYLPSSIGPSYKIYPTASYIRNKIYKPLSLYCDYYEPIRSLYWNSSYWPLYRSASSFVDDLPSEKGTRLQKIFDNETSLIRAQTSALLRQIHDPVPRVRLNWPSATISRHYDVVPSRFSSDNYIHKMLTTSPLNQKSSYTTYYSEPVRKYIGTGRLASVTYAGSRAYNRRPHIYLYENPLQNDIQLLSYYINKFKQEKTYSSDSSKVQLSPARPTRKFGSTKATPEDDKQQEEMRKLRDARAARIAFINEEEKKEKVSSKDVDEAVRAKKEKEEAARLAEERALAEEQVRQDALAKEATRKAEIARQEELAAKAAAERAAELERQAEQAKKEETKKQAAMKKKKQEEEEERARLEEQRKIEEAKAEEALQAQLRLEEIARKAEEEKEADLARQAEELAELARQEAELAEQAKKEAEEEEERRQEAELEQLRREEAELAELERQEQELEEAAKQESEVAERARADADAAKAEAEQAELERSQAEQAKLEKAEAEQAELDKAQAELEELERAQAELDALEAEAKAFESDLGAPSAEEPEPEPEQTGEPEVDEAELARQAELEELRRQEEELEELERAQAELDALEAEAKAMESDLGPPPAVEENDYEDDQAIAEDIPGEQSDVAED